MGDPKVLKSFIQKVVRECKGHPEVAAVYLFGSAASGKQGPLSDYDVALLLGRRVRNHRFFDLRLRLIDLFSRGLSSTPVEVVLLNETPVSFNFSVVKSGKLLYQRDRKARIAFEVRTVQRYLDAEPFERVRTAYLKRYFRKRS